MSIFQKMSRLTILLAILVVLSSPIWVVSYVIPYGFAFTSPRWCVFFGLCDGRLNISVQQARSIWTFKAPVYLGTTTELDSAGATVRTVQFSQTWDALSNSITR